MVSSSSDTLMTFLFALSISLSTGPLTQLVRRSLQVSNPNQQPVAFKVKTTAPKQYCVRPNSGRIEPGETVEVQGKFVQSKTSCP